MRLDLEFGWEVSHMSMLHRLASLLVAASGLTFVACGGGGASSGAAAQNVVVPGDGDVVVQDGREGIPRVGAPQGACARVEIERHDGPDADQRFRVEVAGLAEGAIVAVWVEDPIVPGSFVHVGDIAVGIGGTGALELSTADGDALPSGVASVSALIGLGIELRTPSGNVLFAGEVPAFD